MPVYEPQWLKEKDVKHTDSHVLVEGNNMLVLL